MAITAIEYSLFRSLRKMGALPLGGHVLEIGEANWYGDVGINDLRQDIAEHAKDPEALNARLVELIARSPAPLFEIAKVAWEALLQPASMTAIDFHGTANALRLDLNRPIDLERQFDLVMNLGTLEHVFNVAQAMETIHRHTKPGGVMVHGMPLSGWVEHGFYSFNSTFYFDVARANGYEVVLAVYAELDTLKMHRLADRESILRLSKADGIGSNSLLYFTFKRGTEEAFQYPVQGVYAGALSSDAAESWKRDR